MRVDLEGEVVVGGWSTSIFSTTAASTVFLGREEGEEASTFGEGVAKGEDELLGEGTSIDNGWGGGDFNFFSFSCD